MRCALLRHWLPLRFLQTPSQGQSRPPWSHLMTTLYYTTGRSSAGQPVVWNSILPACSRGWRVRGTRMANPYWMPRPPAWWSTAGAIIIPEQIGPVAAD